jgi:hypothetical protein
VAGYDASQGSQCAIVGVLTESSRAYVRMSAASILIFGEAYGLSPQAQVRSNYLLELWTFAGGTDGSVNIRG